MKKYQTKLNDFLVDVFHEILRIEESSLRSGEFENISVREMHVIEAVCKAETADDGKNRASDIAAALRISGGTLTTAVIQLEKKGCITRLQDKNDKRIVRLFSTDKGKRADAAHQRFHDDMVADVVAALSEDELACLAKGLESLQTFFTKKSSQ